MAKQYHLLAVQPFDRLEKEIAGIRQRIFSLTGYASALALPAVIPLCYLPGNLNPGSARLQLARFPLKAQFSIQAIEQAEDVWFLKTVCNPPAPGLSRELAHQLLSVKSYRIGNVVADPVPVMLFPVLEGFFLAVNQEGGNYRQLQSFSISPRFANFSSFHLILLKINVYSDPENWWNNLEWDIMISVKKKINQYEWEKKK